MRCYVCDKAMTDNEIQVSPDGISYDPCPVCMTVILDAAYSDGFVKEADLSVELGEDGLGSGEVEVLEDPDVYKSTFDHCYAFHPYGED